LWLIAEWVVSPLIPHIDRGLERWYSLLGYLSVDAEENEPFDLAPDPAWVAERAYWDEYRHSQEKTS